jgi:hypothetical protein
MARNLKKNETRSSQDSLGSLFFGGFFISKAKKAGEEPKTLLIMQSFE